MDNNLLTSQVVILKEKIVREPESAVTNININKEIIKEKEKADDNVYADDDDDDDVDFIELEEPHVIEVSSDDNDDSNADFISLKPYKETEPLKTSNRGISQSTQPKPKSRIKAAIKKNLKKKISYLKHPVISEMRKYFHIIEIPIKEQIRGWLSMIQTRYQHTGKILVCRVCNLDFGVRESLRVHFANHIISSGRHQCAVCLVRYKTGEELKDHFIRLHVCVYCCKRCGREFSTRDIAKFHQIIGCDIARTNPPDYLPILSISLQGPDKPWAEAPDSW